MNTNTQIKLLLARTIDVAELDKEVDNLQFKIAEIDPLLYGNLKFPDFIYLYINF
jgi:hypothetical protein